MAEPVQTMTPPKLAAPRSASRRVLLLCCADMATPMLAAAITLVMRTRAQDYKQAIDDTIETTQALSEELMASTAGATQSVAALGERAELERRISDVAKPALVIAELTSACRDSDANVESVRPIDTASAPRTALRGSATAADLERCGPRYSVTVQGDFFTVARLMDSLSKRRLPLRVIGMSTAPMESDDGGAKGMLRGELIVEAYAAAKAARQEPGI